MTDGDGVSTNLLQVTQASRAQYAQSYYGSGADFLFTHDASGVFLTVMSWAQAAHLDHIERVSIICGDELLLDDLAESIEHATQFFEDNHMSSVISKCVFLRFPMEEDDDEYYPEGQQFFGCNRTVKFRKWVQEMNAVELKELSVISAVRLTAFQSKRLKKLTMIVKR